MREGQLARACRAKYSRSHMQLATCFWENITPNLILPSIIMPVNCVSTRNIFIRLGLLFFLMINSEAHLNQTSDDLCTRLQSSQVNITSIGILDDRFVLLTDEHMFNLPINSFNENRLSFGNRAASSLKDKWPKLFKYWDKFGPKFVIQDSRADYVYLVAFDHNPMFPQSDAVYNIEGDNYRNMSNYVHISPLVVWLSSIDRLTTYSVLVTEKKWLTLREYSFVGANVLWNVSKANPSTKEFIVCYESSKNNVIYLVLYKKSSSCQKPVEWNIQTGFVDATRFYMFDGQTVYIFDRNIFTEPHKRTKYIKIKYSNFFQCQSETSTILCILIGVVILFSAVVMLQMSCCLWQLGICGLWTPKQMTDSIEINANSQPYEHESKISISNEDKQSKLDDKKKQRTESYESVLFERNDNLSNITTSESIEDNACPNKIVTVATIENICDDVN